MDWVAIVVLWLALSSTIENQRYSDNWNVQRQAESIIKNAEQDARIIELEKKLIKERR